MDEAGKKRCQDKVAQLQATADPRFVYFRRMAKKKSETTVVHHDCKPSIDHYCNHISKIKIVCYSML